MPADSTGNGQLPSFGGHELDSIAPLSLAARNGLKQLGFIDAEQVMAALKVPNANEHLKTALGVEGPEFDSIVTALHSVVPMIAAAENADTGALPLGALMPTPEIAAMAMAAAEPQMAGIALPRSVNRASEMSPLKNQGGRGTCVAFALTAVHEHHRRTNGGAMRDYSEQFLYHETKLIDGSPTVCGTWQVRAAQVLNQLGQCLESVWPYNGNPPCNNNEPQPGNARNEAQPHKLATVVLNPRDVTAIKTALAAGSVVGFSIPVYNSWYQSGEAARTGRITMRLGSEPPNGGHAMCLIGYQDDVSAPGGGFFILRNSWFGSWGTQCPYGSGNGTIPYAYIATENWEAVTVHASSAAVS